MSLGHGSSIVTDGLVFYYDMGNTIKSWKGKPTTNLVNSPNLNNITSVDIPQEAQQAGITGYSSYSTGYAVFNRATASTSGVNTFNFSVWMRSPTGNSTYLMYVYTGVGGDGGWQHFGAGSLTTSWQRINATRTLTAGTVTSIQIYRYNQTGTIDICAPQLELNSFMTPFVIGTRSSTQAIKDLTNNNIITINSLTYGSNNTFSFDGNNYLYIPSINFSNAQTIEIWLKPTENDATRRNPYNQAYGGYGTWTHEPGGQINYYYGDSGVDNTPYVGHASTFTVTQNETACVCTTRDTSQSKWYKNGVFDTSYTHSYGTLATTSTNIQIGSGYAGGYIGDIFNVKLYNRALSSLEVLQNFEALRKRFNI